jgi:hypothetical protein
VIGNVHMLPDTNTILDRNVVTDRDSCFDKRMVTDIAVSTNCDSSLDVGECPYPSAFANIDCFD